jgi:uncharacterized protein
MNNENERLTVCVSNREIRFTAMWCSLANLIMPASLVLDGTFSLLMAFLISPILAILIWITNRKKHPFIDKSAKQALNFTLSIDLCLAIVTFCLMRSISWWTELYYSLSPEDFIANSSANGDALFTTVSSLNLFVQILIVIHVCSIVFGSIQAARGNIYKYPLSIRFFR